MLSETGGRNDQGKAGALGITQINLMMQAGAWKTPTMVARYTEHLAARRGAMSKLAARQGRI